MKLKSLFGSLALAMMLVLPAFGQKTGNWTTDYSNDEAFLDSDVFIYQVSPYLGAGLTKHTTWAGIKTSLWNSPTLVTPALGTPTALTLTNATGLPVAGLADASANGRSLITAANYAAMKALLDLEIGTDVQAYNDNLTSPVSTTTNTHSKIRATATVASTTSGSYGSYLITIGARRSAVSTGPKTSTGILTIAKGYNGVFVPSFRVLSGSGMAMTTIAATSTNLDVRFHLSISDHSSGEYTVTKIAEGYGSNATSLAWSVETEDESTFTSGTGTTIGEGDFAGTVTVAGDAYLKNSTTATEQRIFNTFTDTSNGEWLQAGWKDTSNTFVMNTTGNGTGVSTGPARNIAMQTNGGNVGIGTASPTTKFHVDGPIRMKATTLTLLGSAATVGAGTEAYITDGDTAWGSTTRGGTATGGGANFVPVVSNGTNWLYR